MSKHIGNARYRGYGYVRILAIDGDRYYIQAFPKHMPFGRRWVEKWELTEISIPPNAEVEKLMRRK